MNDAKKGDSPKSSHGHPLIFGLLAGALVGFGAGWWFPPPASLNMPKVRARARHGAAATAQSARRRAAQLAGALAEGLQESETSSARIHNPSLQAVQTIPDDSPFPVADRVLEGLRHDQSRPALSMWVLPVPTGED